MRILIFFSFSSGDDFLYSKVKWFMRGCQPAMAFSLEDSISFFLAESDRVSNREWTDKGAIRWEARKERVCGSDVPIAEGFFERTHDKKACKRLVEPGSARKSVAKKTREDGGRRILVMTAVNIGICVIGIVVSGSGSIGQVTRNIDIIMRSTCDSTEALRDYRRTVWVSRIARLKLSIVNKALFSKLPGWGYRIAWWNLSYWKQRIMRSICVCEVSKSR